MLRAGDCIDVRMCILSLLHENEVGRDVAYVLNSELFNF